MLPFCLLLFAVVGSAGTVKLGDYMESDQDVCEPGISNFNRVCGGGESHCTSGSQCFSGSCRDISSYYGYGYCTAKYALGDPCIAGFEAGPLEYRTGNGNCFSRDCNRTAADPNGICGGDGSTVFLVTRDCDGKMTCLTDQCLSGLRVGKTCTAQHLNTFGTSCQLNEQCQIGVPCTNNICKFQGGCIPDDKNSPAGQIGNGPSSMCSNGEICMSGRCAQPKIIGAQCLRGQCQQGVTCSSGICGGLGACTGRTTPDGPSDHCVTGNVCVGNYCRLPLGPGYACRGEVCVSPLQCSSGICGGKGACTPDNWRFGNGNGPSANCTASRPQALQVCMNNRCAPALDYKSACEPGQCLPGVVCSYGICGGPGACIPADGNPFGNGYSDDCAKNPDSTCIEYQCSRRLSPGYACDGDQCLNGLACTDGFCGGLSGCTPDGSTDPKNGPSAKCMNGDICLNNQCARPLTLGSECVSGQCGPNIPCIASICGGPGACTPDSGSGGTGPSSQCGTDSICYRYRCLQQVEPTLPCTVDEGCLYGFACVDGKCDGLGACAPDNTTISSGYGISSQCTNGEVCQGYRCAPILNPGDSCVVDAQCASSCYDGTCGAPGARCSTDAGCVYDSCTDSICDDPTTIPDRCQSTADCPGALRCSPSGLCGRRDAPCRPTDPSGDNTGPSNNCFVSGFGCYDGTCQTYGSRMLGESCDATNRCYILLHCTDGACSDQVPPNIGNYCLDNTDCVGSTCQNQICTAGPLLLGYQESCTDSTQCSSGFCAENNRCAGPGGETCTQDVQCSTYECISNTCVSEADLGPQCSSDSRDCPFPMKCGPHFLCGREEAVCYPDAPSGDNSGSSSGCANGYACYNGLCLRAGQAGEGQSCDANTRCSPDFHCINGACSNQVPSNAGAICGDDTWCVGSSCVQGICTLLAPAPGPSDRRKREQAWFQGCPPGQKACPIGEASLDVYECIDPMTNLESCGGCIFGDQSGRDCTTITNADVSCRRGACVIESCYEGYEYIAKNQTCVGI